MRSLVPYLLVAIPALPLLAGLVIRGRSVRLAAATSVAAAGLSAGLALLAGLLLGGNGPLTARWHLFGPASDLAFSLRLDAVSIVMATLVAALGAVVLRFSRTYLAGDPNQTRFLSWMSLTLSAVLTVALAGHLLLLLAAWTATSLSLHRLLLHFPERAGAIFAARKKFVISRLGDLCLLGATLLLYRAYGTGDLEALFAAAAATPKDELTPAGLLLVACAALKSAQFPFHSWLPDTLETPTPVSALMHAGIINAGGFLAVRLAPLLILSPVALQTLAVVGAVTAAFGAMVMLAQSSVKRALAYSTVAQMGFMLLQCGLGAFGLALIHLVAHSLYKAHAFLTAGSTVGLPPRAAIRLHTPALALGLVGGALLVTAGATVWQFVGGPALSVSGVWVMLLVLALAYGLARTWSAGPTRSRVVRSLLVAALIAVSSLGLHAMAHTWFGTLPSFEPSAAVRGFVAAVFVALFLFQAWLWRAGHHSLGRRFYVHALNGFYLGTYANRLLAQLWPRTLTP